MLSLRLTAEGGVSPGTDADPTVLALVDIGFNRFTQSGVRAAQRTQIKYAVFEESLHKHTQLK